jgi:hypothetical protein
MSPDNSSPMFVTATLPDKPVNVSAAICFSFRNDCLGHAGVHLARRARRWNHTLR